MPSYELALLLRTLGKPETATALKRTALNVMKNKGVLFGIENLGQRATPYAIPSFNRRYREGSYFLMRVDLPASTLDSLKDEFDRDTDILKAGFVREKEVEKVDCTLEEELQPPAYREEVKKMIEEGKKKEKIMFRFNIDFPYNPFNR